MPRAFNALHSNERRYPNLNARTGRNLRQRLSGQPDRSGKLRFWRFLCRFRVLQPRLNHVDG